VLEAVLAIVQPIVECNRSQVENGRTYLREMVFGDPAEPRHAEALTIVAQTEEAVAAVLRRDQRVKDSDALTLARVVSGVMFLSTAMSLNVTWSIEEVMHDIRRQLSALLAR
jgi:hypothetical protein